MEEKRIKNYVLRFYKGTIKKAERSFNIDNCFYFSVILGFAAVFLNSSWMFNRYGWLDHFAYLGAAFYFPQTSWLFPLHPTIELLPTYMPNALLYYLFLPQTANFIHDIVYLSISLFMFMRITFFLTKSNAITFLVTIILSSYYYFLSSIGSDYTDSTIQILCMAQLFIIMRLLDQNDPWFYSKKAFFLLGMVSSLTFSSGILSIVYIANFGFFIAIFTYLNRQKVAFKIHELINFFCFWFAGAAIIASLISTYLSFMNGGFYMKQSFKKLFSFLGGAYITPDLMSWLPYSGWLILPCSILIASLLFLLRCHKVIFEMITSDFLTLNNTKDLIDKKAAIREIHGSTQSRNLYKIMDDKELLTRQLSFILLLISISASILFIQFFIRQWSLQFMYFSQINFIYYLGFSVLISEGFKNNSRTSIILLVATTISLSSYSLHFTSYHVISFEGLLSAFPFEFGSIAPWAILVLIFSLAFYLYSEKIIPIACIIFAVLAMNLTSYSQNFGGFCCLDAFPLKFFGRKDTTSENVFDDTITLSLIMDNLDRKREKDVWFDEKDLFGQIFRQVFSMNYMNSPDNLINKLLPSLGDYRGPIGSSGHAPSTSHQIILLSSDETKLKAAIENLSLNLSKRINFLSYRHHIGEVDIYVYVTQ